MNLKVFCLLLQAQGIFQCWTGFSMMHSSNHIFVFLCIPNFRLRDVYMKSFSALAFAGSSVPHFDYSQNAVFPVVPVQGL